MPIKKIKWGVLGFARIARLSIIPALLRSDSSEFYAIASRDASKLDECDRYWEVVTNFSNKVIGQNAEVLTLEDSLRNMQVIEGLFDAVRC